MTCSVKAKMMVIMLIFTAMSMFDTVHACTAGYRDDGSGGCMDCGAGFYCPEGADTYYGCPVGSNTIGINAASIGDCVCSLGLEHDTEDNNVDCFDCRVGYYCEGVAYGQLCSEGSTTEDVGSQSSADCDVCSPGYAWYDYQCHECEEGNYCLGGIGEAAGSSSCLYETGYDYSPVASAQSSDCTCQQGHYDNNGTCAICPMGSWCVGGRGSSPTTCASSTDGLKQYSHAGSFDSDQCQHCPADQAKQYFFGGCLTCEGGYYCPGDDNAYPCPHGTTSEWGTMDPADCFCPSGTYLDPDTSSSCLSCIPNYYCLAHHADPLPCGNGTSETGAAYCVCYDGYYFHSGTGCTTECPTGLKSGTTVPCVCDPEQFTYVEGGEALWRDVDDGTCLQCPENWYCDGFYKWECNATEGLSSDLGSYTCYCPDGYYGNPSSGCTICPPDSYCPFHGEIMPCSAVGKSYSQLGCDSSTCCYHCLPGYYYDELDCFECDVNTYCPGQDESYYCPEGTSTQGMTGSVAISDCSNSTEEASSSSTGGDSEASSTGTGGSDTGASTSTGTGSVDVASSTGGGSDTSTGEASTSTGGGGSDTGSDDTSTGGSTSTGGGDVVVGGSSTGDIVIDGDESSTGRESATGSGLNSAISKYCTGVAAALLPLLSIILLH